MQRAGEGSTGDRGGTTRAERTSNTSEKPEGEPMLDVLKLSGWLNADASCPVERRAFKAGGVWAGRRERVGRWRCEEWAVEGPKGDQGGGHGRSAP